MSSVLDDSCVTEIRAKYAEDHMCQGCWSGLRECPTCKTPLNESDGRSFVVEGLSSKLDEYFSVFAPQPTHSEHRMVECRVGMCKVRLPSQQMSDHVRDAHPANFVEMTEWIDGLVRVKVKTTSGNNQMHFHALKARDKAFFFFIVHVDRNDDLFVEVEVAHAIAEFQ